MTGTKFALDAISPTPWKNGGGTTREIAVWPPGASMDTFAWRISVADIAADGPFSAFPGIDRQIVLIDGAGVHLQAHDDTFCHRLVRVGEPFAFSGDTAVHATLVDGPTRDFNVMTRRGTCRAEIALMRQPFTAVPAVATVLVLALRGSWDTGDGVHLHAGEGLLLPAGSPAVTLFHTELSALCLRVTLHMERDR
ncbi:HutD family protein [Cupriavidus pauculus]|uniref:HutD/Ves family protein n=1 Tax=Cupriavidus pauculus TaxID=82633 RepID=UPI001EE16768|nr:HutD family protein [Cupriavidus pauculus]GJG93387.1 HutD family protein [Cupriavidus pauculus]